MSESRAFHAEGPACEKERSPNLDRSRETANLEEDVDLSREQEQAAVTVRTMLDKYTGRFAIKKQCHASVR